ncbi:MAG: wax ester/triacylglycerol synthase domain-containing protein, partial [Microthrixaceae bacterium]
MPNAERPVQRASPADLATLASDVGPAPMHVGALLRLDGAGVADPDDLVADVGRRIRAVPRLRQRLLRTPLGAGRPVWVDVRDFDITDHVEVRSCPGTGDERALWDLAAEVVVAPLPPDRPMWRMAIVDGLGSGGVAVVVAFHHVLSDGMGALSMLAALVDGGGDPTSAAEEPGWPAPEPDHRELRRDATRARLAAVRSLPRRGRQVLAAAAQLRPRNRRRPAPCSLLVPNGATRRIDVVDVELAALHTVARERQ